MLLPHVEPQFTVEYIQNIKQNKCNKCAIICKSLIHNYSMIPLRALQVLWQFLMQKKSEILRIKSEYFEMSWKCYRCDLKNKI